MLGRQQEGKRSKNINSLMTKFAVLSYTIDKTIKPEWYKIHYLTLFPFPAMFALLFLPFSSSLSLFSNSYPSPFPSCVFPPFQCLYIPFPTITLLCIHPNRHLHVNRLPCYQCPYQTLPPPPPPPPHYQSQGSCHTSTNFTVNS